MKRIFKFISKLIISLVCIVLGASILVVGGLNIAKFGIYADYYSVKTDICKNPGLGDGFICQGICAVDTEDKILVSGYMNDDSASRIYVTDTDNNSYYVSLTSGGEAFTGHAGGIASQGDKIYVASNKKIHVISLDTVLGAKNGDTVSFEESIPTSTSASFIYADENYVYVGEFHNGKNYITEHKYTTPEGENSAIVCRYQKDDLTQPDKIYSIRDEVQGICFTPDGKVVLSTSYGLADSFYYVYNESDAIKSEYTLDGAPVYYLNNCIKEIKGPAMAEGLEYYDGKVITLTESASNKYIFGKLFFAYYIVGLEI